MRLARIAPLLAFLLIAAAPLLANPPLQSGGISIYGAGACAAPEYGAYGLQLGCPQCQSNCCNDAWAGYCQKKHHGFCLPCIRPMPCRYPQMHAPACSNGCDTAQNSTLENDPLPAPASAAPETQPTPAPRLPAAPPTPPALEPSNKPTSQSPSDTTEMPFPVFNPAAWRIGEPIK